MKLFEVNVERGDLLEKRSKKVHLAVLSVMAILNGIFSRDRRFGEPGLQEPRELTWRTRRKLRFPDELIRDPKTGAKRINHYTNVERSPTHILFGGLLGWKGNVPPDSIFFHENLNPPCCGDSWSKKCNTNPWTCKPDKKN